MKRIVVITIGFAVLTLALGLTVFLVKRQQLLTSRAAPATSLQLDPPTLSKALGEIFPVRVLVNSGSNELVTADIVLTFSPTILEVQSVAKGSFFATAYEIQNVVDNTNGKITYSLYTNKENKRVGQGDLVIITIKAKGVGTSPLSFSPQTVAYGLQQGQNVITTTQAGSYTVVATTPTATPLPISPTQTMPTVSPTASRQPNPTTSPSSGTTTPTTPAKGGLTASSTPSPLPTLTPTVSPTSRPSVTPIPSRTPSPSRIPTPTISVVIKPATPQAGHAQPTFIFALIGVFLIVAASVIF